MLCPSKLFHFFDIGGLVVKSWMHGSTNYGSYPDAYEQDFHETRDVLLVFVSLSMVPVRYASIPNHIG